MLQLLLGSPRPPDALSPCVLAHTGEQRRARGALARARAGSQARGGRRWRPGTVLRSGAESGRGRARGGGEQPRRPRSPAGAGWARRASLKLTPSPPNSFSLPARLPHVSPSAENPVLLPALTGAPTPAAAAAAKRGARRTPSGAPAWRPRGRARARAPGGTRAVRAPMRVLGDARTRRQSACGAVVAKGVQVRPRLTGRFLRSLRPAAEQVGGK